MKNEGSLVGLWVVRFDQPTEAPALARVEDDLYALAFTNAPKANATMNSLGAEGGKPFFVLGVNHDRVLRELQDAGARGFIVDYDPSLATFSAAHPLPGHEVATH
jgi:hypothetical protein